MDYERLMAAKLINSARLIDSSVERLPKDFKVQIWFHDTWQNDDIVTMKVHNLQKRLIQVSCPHSYTEYDASSKLWDYEPYEVMWKTMLVYNDQILDKCGGYGERDYIDANGGMSNCFFLQSGYTGVPVNDGTITEIRRCNDDLYIVITE